ncbi:MAG: hypothetical protein KKH04_15395 [Proteobacteria bacterium]|nr:hypothetical protein [Pseudomonadota bacterium]
MSKPDSQVVIYKAPGGSVSLEVKLKGETVWLDAHHMARLFDRDRTVIVRHIRNIYQTKELDRASTCVKNAQVAADGKVRPMDLYNLDPLYHSDGTKRIADNALVAMTLLIAESRPQEKDLLTRVLSHLIHPEKT